MKFTHLLTFILILCVCCVGCMRDAADFTDMEDSGAIKDPNSEGYLSIDSFSFVVETITENVTDDENDRVLSTKSSVSQDDFIVKITNSEGEAAYPTTTYGAIKLLDSPITLPAGVYTVEVMSCEDDDISLADWDCPEYSGSKSCVVGDYKTTSIGEITCSLSNVMVTVEMSIDLIEDFDPSPEDDDDKLKVTIVVGDEELEFDPTKQQNGYFKVPEDGNMTIYLSGMYYFEQTGEYVKIAKGDWEQTISGVKAGQYRNITVYIDHNATGTLDITLDIDGWSVDNQIIDVDIVSALFLGEDFIFAESVIEDPDDETSVKDSPEVTLDGGVDITSVYTISSSIFDTDTKTYSPIYKANITPVGDGVEVANVDIIINSTSEELLSKLQELGMESDSRINVYKDGVSTLSAIGDYLSIRYDDSTGGVVAAVTYDGMLGLSAYEGQHEIKVVATDSYSQGRTSYTTLLFETINDTLPQIEWEGDYDFSNQYEIFTSTQVDKGEGVNPAIKLIVTSNASAGLDKFLLGIESDVLSPEELEKYNLASEMNLITADGEMKAGLVSLDIPVGDEVAGHKSVEIDITIFISILANLGEGESNFTLTVGDSNGEVSETIMLIKK